MQEEKRGGGQIGTLKSDREAMSSSSSRVAEEAEMRVCWLEAARCRLPGFTVMAGLGGGGIHKGHQFGPRDLSFDQGGSHSPTPALGIH